ncbi:adaptor protein MecA [Priestia filamentosa]|jgi:adapter protein MecA 1/2|uniref:Adapter protein MecA n=2 Tax=Priestia endophytica TaxID=135735 RepID=A0A329F2A4_9BACI|nr:MULTISPECIES: adaptor protein MecA [Priestia]KAB2496456.1 adaptor protein MecA [Priestia endophytica]KYG31173.1 adaptor protein MecA [Priestia endophytica]MBG9810909.1 adapter protein MecA [Priestia endophytica]MBG9813425.1 adapter protein MecA [Priestia endophytica]MCM3536530.1 adaptor protein MecA [Priestia endophytica]
MEIERINENTVKFYVSYIDIEERGFDRNEIWFSRERSEELFWDMMDEVHHKEEFTIEGPLWIQVQAMDKGIEVVVTRASLSKDGQKFEVPVGEDKKIDIPVDEKLESLLDDHNISEVAEDEDDEESLQFVLHFKDFEDLISLSHRIQLPEIPNNLYAFENRYYLYVEFFNCQDDIEKLDDILSILLEYSEESRTTVHHLEEYGKLVMKENALEEVKKHFPLLANS